ncbi:MAG: transcription antitermination factor NusB [Deltaproteobacteria bacterium]|nr:transcription antitermination factor NusB [Deltaproteobacteria bacterium]
MGQRRRARECAVQILYQMDTNALPVEQALGHFWGSFAEGETDRAFVERIVRGATDNRAAIDERLATASKNWRLDRMPVVDRAILRAAAYELLFCDDIPARVAINEAIDIAKRFGSEESAPFVNGILDNLAGEKLAKAK